MNVDILCPQCGTLFTVRRELLGKRTKCVKCGTMFVIAEPSAGSAPRADAGLATANAPPAATPATPARQPTLPLTPPPIPTPLPAGQVPDAELPEIITAPRAAPSAPPPPPPMGVHRGAAAAKPIAPPPLASVGRAANRPRFTLLHLLVRVYEVLAILALIAAAMFLALSLTSVLLNPDSALAMLMSAGLATFWALMAAVAFALMAQSVRLALQVEENTRETRRACERLADHFSGIEHEP